MSEITDILLKLRINDIKVHLKNYLNLYLHPIFSWKMAINNKDEYNLIIMHSIYYTLLLFIFVADNFKQALAITTLEIILTLIPFLIFVIPNTFCIKIFDPHITNKKIFILFTIIKFQFLPIIVLISILEKKLEYEPIYIILENIETIVLVLFVITIPIIISLKLWKKILWICLNYLFLSLGICFIVLSIDYIDNKDKTIQKHFSCTPNLEFLFYAQDLDIKEKILDNKYLITAELKDSSTLLSNPQYISRDLYSILNKNTMNSIAKKYSKNTILKYIDSLEFDINHDFENNLNATNLSKDSSIYKSNKEYFGLYYDYLKYYNNLFTNPSNRKKIYSTQKIESVLKIDKNKYLVLYNLDSTYIYPQKQKLLEIDHDFEIRFNLSCLFTNILFYPIEIICKILNV